MTRKEVILQAASRLFSDKGFKETSVAEISEITGVAEGTIFYHYKNKEGLFLSILENLKDEIIRGFEQYFKEKKFASGLDMVEGAISYYLYLAGMKEDRFHLLHHRYPYELAAVNPVCRELLEAIYNCVVDIFEKAVQAGQQDGSIGQMSSRKMALILFSLVDGLVRFKTYNLYDPGGLYHELIAACRRMLGKCPGGEDGK
ncbi:MAG: TetR/AcrR family transcriptional regulator [Deltaproteobacteria bacterium]|nr:TetR/AcrR family transcriptional regulator [Deltaproteobacteria bacterium]